MGKVNRRDFLDAVANTAVEQQTAEDKVYKKYANHQLPTGLAKTTSGLSQYSGAWTETEIKHLLRRTVFGLKKTDIQTLQGITMSQAVDMLLTIPAPPPAPPINNYNTATYTDPTGVALGQTWVNSAYGDGTVNSKRRSSLKSWWMGLIINQDLNIREKMVCFWHNHFATEMATIGDARVAYIHNALLRANALGNFKTFVRQITTDMGMLRYLNGYVNTKTAPDENYARELQELFTLGKTNVPNYDEPDVQAAAKVLTGWRINTTTMTSYFDPTKHDTSNKQFTSFYNNAIINYQSGANGANETDLLIDMIFGKVECAKHICRKLYRYFVYYLIDANIETTIIAPMATTLINNNFDLLPVMSQLLKSDHFYDTNNQGCYIRTPMDFIAGTFRTFGITLPANFTVDKTYAVWNYLRSSGSVIAQDIGDPPNVAGWPAFSQTPDFYELWINSNTLPKRLAFGDLMLGNGFTAGTGTSIKIDVLNFAQQAASPDDPDLLVDFCTNLLLGINVSATKKAEYKSILLSGQTSNYYWTQAWNNYISNPTTTNTNIVKTRLTTMLIEILRMAEHQLC